MEGLLKNIEVDFISLVKRGANQKEIIFKSGNAISKTIEFRKIDEEKRMVYGVVYSPDEIDAQGQFTTTKEIESATERFMKAGKTAMVDKNHDEKAGQGFIKESWIKKEIDPLFPDEKNGSWVVGIKIENEETWDEIKKGEITGLSMQGIATLEPDTLRTFQGEEMPQSEGLCIKHILKKIKKYLSSSKQEITNNINTSEIRKDIAGYLEACSEIVNDYELKDEELIQKIAVENNVLISKVKSFKNSDGAEFDVTKIIKDDEEKIEGIFKKLDELKELFKAKIESIEKSAAGTKQILETQNEADRKNWKWL